MSNMHLAKVTGLAVVAVLAITAFASATASAATWTVEGNKLGEGGVAAEPAVFSKLTEAATLTLEFLQTVEITATTLATASGSVIYQEGTKAKAKGGFVFSGLTVVEPAGCSVKSPIETKPLFAELVGHKAIDIIEGKEVVTEDPKAYVKFTPQSGEVFATVTISGCAIAGSYNIKSSKGVFGEANEWGTAAQSQPAKLNPTINSNLAGELVMGSKPAELLASSTNWIEKSAFTSEGKSFSADK